jgi:hypothetical protein
MADTGEDLLDAEELKLAQKKNSNRNRLVFAIMLKYFQQEKHYPTNQSAIPESLVISLASQLGIRAQNFIGFDWDADSGSVKRFRQEIRSFLGYKEATAPDAEKLIAWLMEHVIPTAPNSAQRDQHAHQFFHENRIEPFSKKEFDNHIRSAMHRFEKIFFSGIHTKLPSDTLQALDQLLLGDGDADKDEGEEKINPEVDESNFRLRHLKKDLAGVKLKHVDFEIKKLRHIRSIPLPAELFGTASRKLIQKYYARIMAALPSNVLEYVPEARYASMASFCHIRSQILTDNLADLFIKLIRKMKASAEAYVKNSIISEVKRVNGKFDILYVLAETAHNHPEGIIQDKIYPHVSQMTLQDVMQDLKHSKGKWYQTQVNTKVRSLYSHAHRTALLNLLNAFTFHASRPEGNALLSAIEFIKKHSEISEKYYPDTSAVPIENLIPNEWRFLVTERHPVSGDSEKIPSENEHRVNQFNYEVAILEVLREQLRCKLIWIEGAHRYRDPEEDLPPDWDTKAEDYYQLLGLPTDGAEFVKTLKELLHQNLKELNDTIISNNKVSILEKNGGHIKITPSGPQAPPTNIDAIQREINRRSLVNN